MLQSFPLLPRTVLPICRTYPQMTIVLPKNYRHFTSINSPFLHRRQNLAWTLTSSQRHAETNSSVARRGAITATSIRCGQNQVGTYTPQRRLALTVSKPTELPTVFTRQ